MPVVSNARWCQVTHRECGGEIVTVVREDKSGMAMCCKKCRQIWREISAFPQDWQLVLVTAPNENRIIIPGRQGGN